MTTNQPAAPDAAAQPPRLALRQRVLDHLPGPEQRGRNLAILVLTTIALFYQFFVPAAVAPALMRHYGMSFGYFANMLAVACAVGAFASLAAARSDRGGRAGMVVWGLALASLLTLVALPHMPGRFTFAVVYAVIGVVQGVTLVNTPALVRDFTPGLGRGTAMSLWAIGPVLASLALAEVASHTLPVLHAFQDQFVIAGAVGLAVFVVALLGLHDLAPSLRSREAHGEPAGRGYVAPALDDPWRHMLGAEVVGPAFAISLYLVLYLTVVAFLVTYLTTNYGFHLADANSLGDWFWAFAAGTLLIMGAASDRLGVRKPLILLAALATVLLTLLIVLTADHPASGQDVLTGALVLMAVVVAVAFGQWLAAFTETLERRNPALAGHGFAIWAWVLQAIAACAFFVLPITVHSVTPLVRHGRAVSRLEVSLAPQLATIQDAPALFAQLRRYPPGRAPASLHEALVAKVGKNALHSVEQARRQLAFLHRHASTVTAAGDAAPFEWMLWWGTCAVCELLMLPLVLTMRGRWVPEALVRRLGRRRSPAGATDRHGEAT